LHGLVGELRSEDLGQLSTKEKVPLVLRILVPDRLSVEMRASLPEVGSTIETWPQLGSSVVLGGAVTADAIRRILLEHFNQSGRFYVDVSEIVRDGAAVPLHPTAGQTPRLERPELPAKPVTRTDGPLSLEEARFLVECAILAPSGGNSQPWRFEYRDGGLLGFIVPERTQQLLDFQNRAAYLALGAAAENIALAAGTLGYAADITVCPDPSMLTLAFQATFTPPRAEDSDLFDQIPLRVTNRKIGPRKPLLPSERTALVEAAAVHDGSLELLEDPADLDAIAALMGCCDRYQLLTPAGHRDVMGELRFNRADVIRTRDGLDVDSLEVSAADRAALAILSDWEVVQRMRQFGGGEALEQIARRAIGGSVAVGLLRMPGCGSASFVRGGRAVQRLWLTATKRGLAIHPWTALPYLLARLEEAHGQGLNPEEQGWFSSLRVGYRKLLPKAPDQSEVMLFRIGRCDPPTARSLRRPVDEVFVSSVK
jgi:nitroreductase